MQTYNKIMSYFWLATGIVTFIAVTYMCIVDDFRKSIYYYILSVIGFGMYFFKRWMVKRMNKHMDYLNQNKN